MQDPELQGAVGGEARERELIETARRRAAAASASTGGALPGGALPGGATRPSGRGPSADAGGLPSFPGYTVVREADRGGQGVVYEAVQASTGRAVAIKHLRGGAFASASSRARLEREVRLLAQLDHEGVCPVIDFLSASDHLFVVMPFLAGENLARRIARAREVRLEGATLEQAFGVILEGLGTAGGRNGLLGLVEDLARTVHDVHERGIVHRDLKPGNVMLRSARRPVVLDFGLALDLSADDAARFTPDGEPVGTPAYMAPEQIEHRGVPVDRRADVYALGAVLYELLTLQRAFRGASLIEVCGDIAHGRFALPRALEPALTPDLEAVCLRAMATAPEDRYATTLELAEDLARVQRGEATRARPLSRLERGWRALRRRAGLAAALAVTIGALLFALASPPRAADPLRELVADGSPSALADLRASLGEGPAELLAFEPADAADLERWLAQARARFPAQGSDEARVELLAPRAAILDPSPAFVLRVPASAREESDYTRYELRLYDGARELRTLSVTQFAGEGSTLTAKLDAEQALPAGFDYAFTVEQRGRRFDPAAGLALATFRVVDPAELAARLDLLPATSSPALAGLGRAAVMLSLDLAEAAREELARLPVGLPAAEAARAELLLARAAALLGDDQAARAHGARARELDGGAQ